MAQTLRREQAALQSFAAFTQSDPPELASSVAALAAQAATLNGWLDAIAVQRGVRTAPSAGATPGAPQAAAQGPASARVPRRIAEFGPLTFQNDDVLLDRLGPERVRNIKLLSADSSRLLNAQESGEIYAYEIVNFVDGKRSVEEIRDAVSGELGPISLDVVSDYLQACEEAKIIAFR
jgi:hypothetical protein